jgi:hypothetical protein
MKLVFSYRLVAGSRTNEAYISDGTHEARMEIWLVSDALGDLLRCQVQLLQGYEYAWCVWEDEPGEHKWLFHCQGDALQIRILRFPTSFAGYGAPDEKANVLFEATCSLVKFATKVRNAVRQLIAAGEAEEYARQLRGEFPQTQYEQLRELIHERQASPQSPRSILELQGLGKEIWRDMEAQAYTTRERASWDG